MLRVRGRCPWRATRPRVGDKYPRGNGFLYASSLFGPSSAQRLAAHRQVLPRRSADSNADARSKAKPESAAAIVPHDRYSADNGGIPSMAEDAVDTCGGRGDLRGGRYRSRRGLWLWS